jgi:hypothetical protein
MLPCDSGRINQSVQKCMVNRERRSGAKMDALGKKKKIGCGEAACPWMAKRSRRTAQISISRLFSINVGPLIAPL